jgi:hypothetical protein
MKRILQPILIAIALCCLMLLGSSGNCLGEVLAGGNDECLRGCIQLLVWGLGSGMIGIAGASLWLAIRLGLVTLPIGYRRGTSGKREVVTNDDPMTTLQYGSFAELNSTAAKIKARDRETHANDAPAREAAEANAADAPIDGEDTGWLKVSPFGTFPGSKPSRPQIFTEAESNAIVAEFNSLRGRLGRLFRGAPVFIGHPDQNPDLYTDHRRLGKIITLQTRADGLWAEVEWNALGRENLQEGYWVYPSPRWDAPAGRAEFRPDRLLSIGLTNTPRIPTSEPVTNSEEAPSTKHQAPNEDQDQTTTTDMDRKVITEKLGLPVTATDEEILAKLDSLTAQMETAEAATQAAVNEATAEKAEKENLACSLAAETARATALAADLQASREAHANALLDAAQAAGRITPADRPAWLPRLTGENREAEANNLAAIKPVLNTSALDIDRNRGAVTDEKARRETIANAVSEIMTKKGVTYHEAWNLAKRDPALKPVFEAMQRPA